MLKIMCGYVSITTITPGEHVCKSISIIHRYTHSLFLSHIHTHAHDLTHTHTHIYTRLYGPLNEGMGKCVLSVAAINYKVLGLCVLIRGINVNSFPLHTPPFASINAVGEQKSVRASEREGEASLCFI